MAHLRLVDLEVRQQGTARAGAGVRGRGGGKITALSCHGKLARWRRSAQLHTDLFIPSASPACSALARARYLLNAAEETGRQSENNSHT